jgi:hypothetical protein
MQRIGDRIRGRARRASAKVSERARAGSAQACSKHFNWADQVRNA